MTAPFAFAMFVAAMRQTAATAPSQSAAAMLPPGFAVRQLDTGEPQPREFVVFVPRAYSRKDAWPVLIFLHGSGESGTNSHRQLQVGLGPYIAGKRLNDFPFITLFPQVPPTPRVVDGFAGRQGDWVWQMLEMVQREWRVDSDRVYLTGLSLGGFGTWDLAMQHPDRFAAIAPVCGGSLIPECIGNLRDMPVWAFHGRDDDRVPARSTRDLVDVLRKAGGKPKYTEYPGLKHNCWDRTYQNKELYDWLLTHRRAPTPPQFTYTISPASTLPLQAWWTRVESLTPERGSKYVRWAIEPDGLLGVELSGIASGALLRDASPLKPGQRLRIQRNGQETEIEMKADITLTPTK